MMSEMSLNEQHEYDLWLDSLASEREMENRLERGLIHDGPDCLTCGHSPCDCPDELAYADAYCGECDNSPCVCTDQLEEDDNPSLCDQCWMPWPHCRCDAGTES